MLKIDTQRNMTQVATSISSEMVEMLDEMCELYNTGRSQIIRAILCKYMPDEHRSVTGGYDENP